MDLKKNRIGDKGRGIERGMNEMREEEEEGREQKKKRRV
jgi:hypothetical protein